MILSVNGRWYLPERLERKIFLASEIEGMKISTKIRDNASEDLL